jgi:hypothetical protein
MWGIGTGEGEEPAVVAIQAPVVQQKRCEERLARGRHQTKGRTSPRSSLAASTAASARGPIVTQSAEKYRRPPGRLSRRTPTSGGRSRTGPETTSAQSGRSSAAEARRDHGELGLGAPFELDAVVEKLAARGADLTRRQTRNPLIVPDQHHGSGPLGEGANEAEDLPRVAARENEVGDLHSSRRADAGTRTPDPLLTMEVLYRLSYVGGLPADDRVVGGAGFEPA